MRPQLIGGHPNRRYRCGVGSHFATQAAANTATSISTADFDTGLATSSIETAVFRRELVHSVRGTSILGGVPFSSLTILMRFTIHSKIQLQIAAGGASSAYTLIRRPPQAALAMPQAMLAWLGRPRLPRAPPPMSTSDLDTGMAAKLNADTAFLGVSSSTSLLSAGSTCNTEGYATASKLSGTSTLAGVTFSSLSISMKFTSQSDAAGDTVVAWEATFATCAAASIAQL